jgi:hypothetical protein
MARHPAAWAPPWGVPTEPLLPPRGRGRWRWAFLAAGGFLGVLSWVLTHDTAPGIGLSPRSWLTLGLAALVVVLLSAYRAAGLRPLLRAVAEYTAVALLAVLLTSAAGAAGGGQHAKPAAQPAVIRGAVAAYDRLAELWHQAKDKADQQQAPTTTRPRGRHR